MAFVVELLRFVAVVDGENESAMQTARRIFDPIARGEIHFGHLPFAQGNSLCFEVLSDCDRRKRSEFLAEFVAVNT